MTEATNPEALDNARGVDYREAKVNELTSFLIATWSGRDRSTLLSAHGRLAATNDSLWQAEVDIDIPLVAPLLLEQFGGPCVDEEAAEDEVWATAKSDFELAVRRQLAWQESAAEREDRDVPAGQLVVGGLLTRVLDSGCRTVLVPAVPVLTAICDSMSRERVRCAKFHQLGSLDLRFSDDGFLGLPPDAEAHLDRHRQFARNWRYLSAHLAARIDDIGRRVAKEQHRELTPQHIANANEGGTT